MRTNTPSIASVFCALCMIAGGTGVSNAQAIAPAVNGADLSWVEKRVQEWQSTPDERRVDEIGWARDIRDAERLARESKRPIFLFSHDGHLDVGRC